MRRRFCLTSIKCDEKTPRSPLTAPCRLAAGRPAASCKDLEFFTLTDEGERLSKQPHLKSSWLRHKQKQIIHISCGSAVLCDFVLDPGRMWSLCRRREWALVVEFKVRSESVIAILLASGKSLQSAPCSHLDPCFSVGIRGCGASLIWALSSCFFLTVFSLHTIHLPGNPWPVFSLRVSRALSRFNCKSCRSFRWFSHTCKTHTNSTTCIALFIYLHFRFKHLKVTAKKHLYLL